MLLAVQGFKYAAEPFFFSNASNKQSPQLFAYVMRYFIVCCVMVEIAVVANIDWVAPLALKNDQYLEGIVILPYLFSANIFLGVYYNLAVWYKLTDRTNFGAFISAFGALVTLSANALLIPLLGYVGSAIATLVCYVCMTLISFFLGRRYYPIPYQWLHGLALILLGFGICWTFLHFQLDNTLLNWLYKNGCVVMLAILMFLLERKKILCETKFCPRQQSNSSNKKYKEFITLFTARKN